MKREQDVLIFEEDPETPDASALLEELSETLQSVTGRSGRVSFGPEDVRAPRSLFVVARGDNGGTLVLGAAGFLKGRKATTHPAFMQYLEKFTENAAGSRIVDDGNIITAGGVTSAIDLGLYFCERAAGKEAREKIRRQMDYHAYPY